MSTAAIMDQHDYSVNVPEQEQTTTEYAIEEQKAGSLPSIWRSILQMKVLLPYLGKILPMLDNSVSTALAPVAPRQDLAEVTRSFADVNKGFLDLQAGQREIRSHVQEQAGQLRRIDDQLLRLRESTERNTMEHQELVEDLRSASKLVRNLSAVMMILMVAVVIMVGFMLMHWHR